MPRGGFREGSGGQPTWKHGKTKTIRVPEVLAEQILDIARTLDRGESLFSLEPIFEPVTGSKVIDLSGASITPVAGEMAIRLEELIRLGYKIKPDSLAEMVAARIRRKRYG
jgi:hypothetical protein